MNEEKAREILGDSISEDGCLGPEGIGYVGWEPDAEFITLDGEFTLDDVEALAWWMRNKAAK